MRETPLPSKCWQPVRIAWHNDQLHLHWLYFRARRLSEPFFENEIQRTNFNPLFVFRQ